jgi:hypothetical protein
LNGTKGRTLTSIFKEHDFTGALKYNQTETAVKRPISLPLYRARIKPPKKS